MEAKTLSAEPRAYIIINVSSILSLSVAVGYDLLVPIPFNFNPSICDGERIKSMLFFTSSQSLVENDGKPYNSRPWMVFYAIETNPHLGRLLLETG